MPSRLPTQSSTLYANNISKLLLSMTDKEAKNFLIDLNDEVVRGSIILHEGKLLWPPPAPKVEPVKEEPKKVIKAPPKELLPSDYFKKTMKDAMVYTAGLSSLIALGTVSPNSQFTTMTTTFGLAGIVGYHTVWGVTPALHSPLMSVTNAISGLKPKTKIP